MLPILTSTPSNSSSFPLVLQKKKEFVNSIDSESSTDNEFHNCSNEEDEEDVLSDNSRETQKANDVKKKENLGPSQDTITPLLLQRQSNDYISPLPLPKKDGRRKFVLRQLSDDDDLENSLISIAK